MNDINPTQKATATAYVYEGDEIQYDADGNITNKLKRVQKFEDLPVEKIEQ